MSGFSIEVDAREVNAALARLREQVGNLTPAMRAIGQTLVTDADLGFRAQSDPWGAPWEPLAASTLKRRRGKRAQILRDTGRLANSFSYRADARSVEVGTNVAYAAIHQFGGTTQRAASQRTLYFRQAKDGKVGNRFVKKRRSNFAQDVNIGAHAVTIPARPMLPIRNGQVDLPNGTAEAVVGLVHDFLDGRLR